jgi:hypothetical protein
MIFIGVHEELIPLDAVKPSDEVLIVLVTFKYLQLRY